MRKYFDSTVSRWPIFSGQGYFARCPLAARLSGMHRFSCPPITFSEAVFVPRCEKWRNCILNGLWVERQAWRMEGWVCPVSGGICASERSGSLLCRRVRRITMTLGIISSTQTWRVVFSRWAGHWNYRGMATKHTHKEKCSIAYTRILQEKTQDLQFDLTLPLGGHSWTQLAQSSVMLIFDWQLAWTLSHILQK